MFQRLKLVVFVIIFAAIGRHVAAQNFGYPNHELEMILGRGYTDEELVAEKKLLKDQSRGLTWESLPLIKFPRFVLLPNSLRVKLGDDKFRELQQSRIEEA